MKDVSPFMAGRSYCCIILQLLQHWFAIDFVRSFILIHSFILRPAITTTYIPPANQSIIPDLSDPSSFPCVKMTTAATEYNNDDEWHIHRDSMLGLSPGGISNTFFNDAAVDDEDDEPEPGEEFELVDDVVVDTGFFDEEDVIGYYVSYDQHDANNNNDDDDDDDSGEEDEDEEEFIPPCPPVDPVAMAATATATSFRTPTTPTTTTTATTTRPQDDRAVTASSTCRGCGECSTWRVCPPPYIYILHSDSGPRCALRTSSCDDGDRKIFVLRPASIKS